MKAKIISVEIKEYPLGFIDSEFKVIIRFEDGTDLIRVKPMLSLAIEFIELITEKKISIFTPYIIQRDKYLLIKFILDLQIIPLKKRKEKNK